MCGLFKMVQCLPTLVIDGGEVFHMMFIMNKINLVWLGC